MIQDYQTLLNLVTFECCIDVNVVLIEAAIRLCYMLYARCYYTPNICASGIPSNAIIPNFIPNTSAMYARQTDLTNACTN
jgi:hypothetical protein